MKLLEEFLVTERCILQSLGFDLQMVHPYHVSISQLKDLKASIPRELSSDLRQCVYNFLNDRYSACVRSFNSLDHAYVNVVITVFCV